ARGASVERHLVDDGHIAPEADGAGCRVVDLDDRLEQLHRPVVAALGGELNGAAELEGCRVEIALLARLESLLNALGELGLAGVVGDLATDPGRELLVLRPD